MRFDLATHTHTHAHTCTHTCTHHTHTCTHMHAHIHTHAHTHAHMHTHMHTCVHTTHINVFKSMLLFSISFHLHHIILYGMHTLNFLLFPLAWWCQTERGDGQGCLQCSCVTLWTPDSGTDHAFWPPPLQWPGHFHFQKSGNFDLQRQWWEGRARLRRATSLLMQQMKERWGNSGVMTSCFGVMTLCFVVNQIWLCSMPSLHGLLEWSSVPGPHLHCPWPPSLAPTGTWKRPF